MMENSRLQRVSNLAIPLVAGVLATNLMSFVDTLMVAQLGDAALAGVGIGGQFLFLLLGGALGLAAGVQALVARRVGEERLEQTGVVLNAGIILAAIIGTALIAIGYALAPPVMSSISGDLRVSEQGLAYLDTRMPSILIIAINISFRSYWVGISLAKWAMVSIVTLSIANVVFNYLLIFGNFGMPKLGVAGAGLGSTLAMLVGLLVSIVLATRLALANGFARQIPSRDLVTSVLKISYPESLRQMLFSLGVVTMYALIGALGTRELAAFHVIISICLIAYMPHIGIGGAATTLVGEALGRNDARDAKLWGNQVSTVGLVMLTGIGVLIAAFAQPILRLFLVDEATLAIAIVPLQLAVFAHVLDGYGKISGSALIGAGATKTTLKLTLLPQWLMLLPALWGCVLLGYGLVAAMSIFLLVSCITALLFTYSWQRGSWATATV